MKAWRVLAVVFCVTRKERERDTERGGKGGFLIECSVCVRPAESKVSSGILGKTTRNAFHWPTCHLTYLEVRRRCM